MRDPERRGLSSILRIPQPQLHGISPNHNPAIPICHCDKSLFPLIQYRCPDSWFQHLWHLLAKRGTRFTEKSFRKGQKNTIPKILYPLVDVDR